MQSQQLSELMQAAAQDAVQYAAEEHQITLDNSQQSLALVYTNMAEKHQREQGKSFVSRTRIQPARYFRQPTVVFRVVLANPLTSHEILNQVLIEQGEIAALDKEFLPALLAMVNE